MDADTTARMNTLTISFIGSSLWGYPVIQWTVNLPYSRTETIQRPWDAERKWSLAQSCRLGVWEPPRGCRTDARKML